MARVPVYEGDRVAPASPMGARLRPVDNGGGVWGGVAQGLQSLGGGLNQMSDDAKTISDINGAKRLDIEASDGIAAIQRDALGAKGEAAPAAAADADRRLTEMATAILERARTDPERAAVSQSLERRMALSRRLMATHLDREVRAGAEQVAQDRATQSARLAVEADDEEDYHTQLRTGLNEITAAARRRGEDAAAIAERGRAYMSDVDRRRIQRFVDGERLGAAEAFLVQRRAEMAPAERAAAERALEAPRRSARVRAIADGAEARVAEAQGADDQGGGLAAMAPRERLAALLASLDADRSLDPADRSAAKDELVRRENAAAITRRADERAAERAAWDFVEARGKGGFTSFGQLPAAIRATLSPEARDQFDALALINGDLRPAKEDGDAAWSLKALAHEDPQAFLDTDLRGWRGALTSRSFDELTEMQELIRTAPNGPELALQRRVFEGVGRALGGTEDAGAEEMAPRFDDGVYRPGESGGAMLRAEPYRVPAAGGAGLFRRVSGEQRPRIRILPPAWPSPMRRGRLPLVRPKGWQAWHDELPAPPPYFGPGSGKYRSERPTLRHYEMRVEAHGLVGGAILKGMPQARRMMWHYLHGDGAVVRPDIVAMRDEIPEFKRDSDKGLRQLNGWVSNYVKNNYAGKPMSFRVGADWSTYEGTTPVDGTPAADWHYALNGFHFAHSAQVSVTPSADGSVSVSIVPQLHVFDRYNWDRRYATVKGSILGHEFTRAYLDKDFAQLHRAGLARDFDVVGALTMPSSTLSIRPARRAKAVTGGT
ncbi:hypothetical protein FHS96_000147 [Sphingomonas zeicaulis]|uniref:hypothetical protein n=1 Tax=Sphingomonas zeicaulis TaxID=1632740 RepID=UPI003D1E3BF4